MPNQPNSCISTELLDQAVTQTMDLLVACDSIPSDHLTPGDPDDVSLGVYCDEDQQSAVLVRCSRSMAETFAEKMLEIPRPELAEADLLDATGEVVNVIAGTLRGLLPTIGTMSTPFQIPSGELDHLPLNERQYRVGTHRFHLSVAFNHCDGIAAT